MLRRIVAWAASAVILLVAGSLVAGWVGDARRVNLSLLLAVASSLPIFLLWPVPERRILDRFRQLDEEMVFEAYLEAEVGPVRELLRSLAENRASALALATLPREPWTQGLRGLCLTALLVLGLGEGLSRLVRGRSLVFAPEPPVAASRGERIEDQGFSDFATEDPAARRMRREQALERAESGGSSQEGARSYESTGRGSASSRRAPRGYDEPEEGPDSQASVPTKPGERPPEASAGGERTSSTPGETPGGKGGKPGEGPAPTGRASTSQPGGESTGLRATPGRTGQGYDHTGDTKVPSPLLDYRARFESRYAERTGKRLAASGRMGFGELREFQRRYFESFALQVDVGPGDDPYVSLLKKRWADVKGVE